MKLYNFWKQVSNKIIFFLFREFQKVLLCRASLLLWLSLSLCGILPTAPKVNSSLQIRNKFFKYLQWIKKISLEEKLNFIHLFFFTEVFSTCHHQYFIIKTIPSKEKLCYFSIHLESSTLKNKELPLFSYEILVDSTYSLLHNNVLFPI